MGVLSPARRAVPFFAVASALALVACGASGKELRARARVVAVFDGLQAEGPGGSSGAAQAAAAAWRIGPAVIGDAWELDRASRAFAAWAAEKGLDRKIDGYDIVRVEDVGPLESLVTVTVESRTLGIRVPSQGEMRWDR